MAILFNCPYCTSSIKVPDSAAGKLGECPKCATKIRIPVLEIPKAEAAASSVAPSAPVSTPAPAASSAAEATSAASSESPQSFDFSKLNTATAPKREVPRPAPTRTAARGHGKYLGVGIMLALLAVAGVGGWVMFQNQPVYTAVATGTHAPSAQGITVSVPWATVLVEQSRQPPVVEYFKRHQTSILSNILKIEIAASLNGLEIRAVPQEGNQLIGVDPHANEDLKKWIASHEVDWDTGRRAVLAKYGKDMCDNLFEAQMTGGKVSNISDYRDVVALNALVRGLGRHVLATTADHKTFPCIFEDKDGKLYFIVPLGTRDFAVVEKNFEGQPRALPSQFRLQVTVAPAAAGLTPIAQPAADPAPAEPAKIEETAPSEPEMKDKKEDAAAPAEPTDK